MRVSESMFSTARCARDTKIAEGNIFSFLLRGQKRKKAYALVPGKSIAGHINVYIRKKL